MYYIYCYTNKINGKQYIGSTINPLNIRYNQHKYNSQQPNNPKYNYPLYQAFRKYGLDNFDYECLQECNCSEEKLRLLEQQYIDMFDCITPKGYNQTRDTLHPINTKESYEKMKQTKRDNANQVAELDENNNIINFWNSIIDCAEQENLNAGHIADCCRGERKTTDNRRFCWIINDELKIPEYIGQNNYKGEKGTTQIQSTSRKVAKIDLDTNKVIQIYDTIALASRENNCDNSAISKVCRGLRKRTGGFGWKYVE